MTSGRPHVFWHGPDRVGVHERPLVVLVNGWTASGLLWPAGFVEQLEGSFDVVRVDNRGSGYSRTAPAPFTMAQLADDLRDVLRAIGARSATIVGLSMGGMIAQELAIRHPELVDRLVLCGTRPPPPAGFAPPRSVLDAMMATPGHARIAARSSNARGVRSSAAISANNTATAACTNSSTASVSGRRREPA